MRRQVLAIVISLAVIGAVIAVIVVAWIPLPEFAASIPGTMAGSIAFVDQDNCVQVTDLGPATTDQIWCEPGRGWIDQIVWSEEGIEMTTYLNQRTTRVLDPDTGELLETRTGNDAEPPPPAESLVVDRSDSSELVVYDETGDELITLTAPESYWIEVALPSPDGRLVAIADSTGRLAVFALDDRVPVLVAEDVQPWPYPVWRP
jgi:hypothetical protein